MVNIRLDTENFDTLQKFVNLMNGDNSSLYKKEILELYKDNEVIKAFLYYTYNTFIQFNVTSSAVEKWRAKGVDDDSLKVVNISNSFSELLISLSKREISGNNALRVINDTIEFLGESYREVFYLVLDRDLKIRCGLTTINKIMKDLIPTFSVALGEAEDKVGKIDYIRETYYASRKLDGLRCIVIIDENGNVRAFSREGKEFLTINSLIEKIKSLGLRNVALDGELCIVDENGNEDFKAIQSQFRRKEYQIEDPRLLLFDILSLDDFNREESTKLLSERFQDIFELSVEHPDIVNFTTSAPIIIVDQTRLISHEQYLELKDKSVDKKWEGLILRKNAPYKGKRSKDIVKVKLFKEEEFVVLGIETGPFRVINQTETGSEECKEEVMTNVFINYKGNVVSVGSGFSLEERRDFFQNPEKIIGKEITVKYFQESRDKEGKVSLRFPIYKCVWEEGTRKKTE